MMQTPVSLDAIAADYKKLAKTYDQRWATFNAAPHDWIMEQLQRQNHAPRKVIDLGCGTGLLLARIAAEYPLASLSGCDASAEMLAITRHKLPEASLSEADIETQEIEGQFDTILSVNVLHHLGSAQAHIGALPKLCAENGTVYLCDFALDSLPMKLANRYWKTAQPSYTQAYSHHTLKTMIEVHFVIKASAILKPDRFWRLQIYKLASK